MVSPQVMAPRAAVANKPPSRSSVGPSSSWRVSRTNTMANTIAPVARGRFIRKIERHPTVSMSQPPSTGPTAPITAPMDAQMPIARPRASPEKAAPRIARLLGMSNAAPTPCRLRPTSNHGRLGASAQAIEAPPNIAVPKIRRRTRPKRSPAAPPEQQQRAKWQEIGVDYPLQVARAGFEGRTHRR